MLFWLVMSKTETKNFARLVNTNRALLIKYLSLLSADSLGHVSKALTKHAIEHQYVSERFPPTATALKCWYIENHAPQWACRAAFDLLIQLGWTPQNDIEKAITARYLILNQYILSDWYDLLSEWLDISLSINYEKMHDC